MSKTLEQKLEKAGEEIAANVMDAAVDLTVTVVKEATVVGKEVVKEAIAEAKEAAVKVINEATRRSMDSAKEVTEAVEAVVADVSVCAPTLVVTLKSVKEDEPVAPESVDEKK